MTAEPPVYGSDLVVDLLSELDIDVLACNPGATFRGLHDSVVNHGAGTVTLIECLHEETSVAIAHGYAKAAGKPMAVALHDVVGLLHATMAIYNAWCDRVPVLLIGATGPMDTTKRRPWIDWIHTANVQATQIRDYTKWDDQPASIAAVPESLVRAVHLATSEPQGPVYVCLDTELQEDRLPSPLVVPPASAFARPAPVAPDRATVSALADLLTDAERPLVVADGVGRSEVAFDALVDIADLLSLPVLDREFEYNKFSLNFPTRHPLNVSGLDAEHVASADAVLALESRDVFGTLNGVQQGEVSPRTAPGARVASVSMASFITKAWANDFQRLQPLDLNVTAELEPTLLALREELRARPLRTDVEQRRRRIAERTAAAHRAWRQEADRAATDRPITWSHLAMILGDVTAGHDRVLANGHLGNWVHRLWDLDRPHQYLGSAGGGGLGYGLGAGIGAALAHRDTDRLVINIQSDGDALFTTSALWTAAHYRLPMLIVMDNNRAFNNSLEHAGGMARRRSRPFDRRTIGTLIDDPVVDFATVARGFGVEAIGPIDDPADLDGTLREAVDRVVHARAPVLVDVVTARHDTPR